MICDGRLVGELDDMFGEVGFDPPDPRRFEGVRQADFLAQHAFRPRHRLGARRLANLDDDLAGLFGIARPMDLRA